MSKKKNTSQTIMGGTLGIFAVAVALLTFIMLLRALVGVIRTILALF